MSEENQLSMPAPEKTAPDGEMPPTQAPVSSGGLPKAFLAGLAGGVVVTAITFIAGLAFLPTLQEKLLESSNRRLGLLERAIEDLNPRLSALEQQEKRLGQSETSPSLQGLTQRLATLEAEPRSASGDSRLSSLSADVSRLATELDGLRRAMPPEGAILRLADRAATAEKEAREIAAQNRSAQALLLAVGQLRDAVDRGDAYDFELRAARRLASPDSAASLEILTADAATGIPRREVLVAQFPALADQAAQAALLPPGGDFWQRSLGKIHSLISLRRIDGQGNDTAARLARAERPLQDGDLGKAVEEIAGLDGAPAGLFDVWLKSAKARVAADKALSQLAAAAIVETAKGGS
ncbi:MAG TPA: hypothetical protein HPP80_06575 [Rhodospirillaceae bacterium]|nr:hypothetical protein [Rhodospirillaceae bacterium]